MQDILPQLEELIAPIVEREGCELVEVIIAGVKSSSALRIFVHRPGGITVDKITRISRKISEELDRTELVEHRYFLEVSSPGLNRPLRSVRDFVRAMSENVRVVTSSGTVVEGVITKANKESLVIVVDGKTEEIPFDQITAGKIIF